ncbi:MAG: prepilin-type N-terminal cleavage/methylation domain-containing protein [Lachnospiraceae bacterium]|nr:prepilin-type N-terminal cleavage/methylation domain-containing protein [Lachnospiraceae bacterium]
MKRQKGYSLIEVIIAVAIMAILATMSFVTLGVINKARCSSAATSLEGQMSSLWIKTKAISQAKKQTTSQYTEDNAWYPLCMEIVKNTSDVTLADGSLAKEGSYSVILGYNKDGSFTAKTTDVAESVLPNILSIKYTPKAIEGLDDDSQKAVVSGIDYKDSFLIQFNKADGSVTYGAGTYEIIYNDKTVYKVVLDASTGKHYIR